MAYTTYKPPGVYVDTTTDQTSASILSGIRLPAFIGVGQEFLNLSDFEVVRGSSAVSDIRIIGEDVSAQFDGTNRVFEVANGPIVDGSGSGIVTNDPNTVLVTVDGQPSAAVSLDGLNSTVTLGQIPSLGSVVKVSYFSSRKDNLITDDDLSNQANGSNKVFKVNYGRIVSGNNGGVTTTDPTRVLVKVNNVAVAVSSVDGEAETITLTAAPSGSATVLATYYVNTWQNTFDFLPENITITQIDSVGNIPGNQDYFQGTDFVIEPGNKIQWGPSLSVASDSVAGSGSVFGSTQVSGTLIDNRFFLRPVAGAVDGTNKTFALEVLPVQGTGYNVLNDNTNLMSVYVGTSVEAAFTAGPVKVATLTGGTKTFVLKDAPAIGTNVYATYYYSMITDDTFTLTNEVASTGLLPGTYSVSSENFGSLVDSHFSIPDCVVGAPNFAIEGITFPAAGEDTQTVPKYSVAETVTLTFTSATAYSVTSSLGGTGSSGFGNLNQTYVDNKTGLRFTVMAPVSFSYTSGDQLVILCSNSFTTASTPVRAIPGIKMVVTDTTLVDVGSTALVTTFNKSSNNPTVGDSYYVSLEYEKTDFTPAVYDNQQDVVNSFGTLSTTSPLTLAAYLAFLNGCPAVAMVQVKKNNTGIQANDEDYIAAMQSLETPMTGNIVPNFLVCLTTSQSVIQFQKKHVEKVSSDRYAQERVGIFGFAVGTTPESAQNFARSLRSERMIGIYPDGAVVSLVDAFGNQVQTVVDGSYLAAAVAGLACNPSFDVATPLTRKSIVGFTSLFRKLDAVASNQTATAGITILTEQQASMQIRHAVTTDMSNALTREPTIVFIKDEVQRDTRAVLDPFIGQKFLQNKLTDIEITVSNMLKGKVQAEKIVEYKGVSATVDPSDPTQADVVAFYSPVFPLNWIQVNYTIRTSL